MRIGLSLAAAGATVGVFMAASAAHQPATAKSLVYNTYIPAGHTINTAGVLPYFEKVKEQTDGSITFDFFAGGALASGKTTLNGIRTGALDSGALVDLYTPGDLPISTMLSDLFLFGEDARVMAAAMNETMLLDCEECLQDYVGDKVLPLGFISTSPYLLQCKSPVTAAEDLAGKRVRATAAMGVLAANLGGTAVNVTSSEVYEAMQRGNVDCFMGSGAWLENYALWEVTTHVTELPLGTYHGSLPININTDTWESLAENERQALLDHAAFAVRGVMEGYLQDEAEVKAESQKRGVTWVDPEDSLRDAIAEARTKEAARVAEVAAGRGVENASEIIEVFLDNVEKWTGIMAEIGDDYDAYEAALKREIFDKVQY